MSICILYVFMWNRDDKSHEKKKNTIRKVHDSIIKEPVILILHKTKTRIYNFKVSDDVLTKQLNFHIKYDFCLYFCSLLSLECNILFNCVVFFLNCYLFSLFNIEWFRFFFIFYFEYVTLLISLLFFEFEYNSMRNISYTLISRRWIKRDETIT